ncbi:MAG: ATP synthase F0 subunit B [Aquificae bacterium]|nr:ATP synthase F0 subunit B [Aquificota bacterium]
MRKVGFWGVLGVMLAAGVAAAAEQGGHGGGPDLHSPWVLVWKGINIAVVIGALVYFFREPFLRWVEEYKNRIIQNIREAEQEHRKAKEELEKARKALEEAKEKYEESLKVAEETARRERETILAQAREIAERIREKAEKVVEIETNKAKEELRRYAAQKAIELSERMLKEVFSDPEVQKKYAERMLSELSKN